MLPYEFRFPMIEHEAEPLRVIGAANRILQHRGAETPRIGLHQRDGEGTADASAHQMTSADAQVIQQGELVGGIGLPAIGGAKRSPGLAAMALVHRDDPEIRRQFLPGIEGYEAPGGNLRADTAGCEQQQRVAGAVFLEINGYIRGFE